MLLSIKVTPKSKKTEYYGKLSNGIFKIRLKATPEKGKANEELIDFLAESFKINPREIQLVSGHSSPRKKVQIPDHSKLPW